MRPQARRRRLRGRGARSECRHGRLGLAMLPSKTGAWDGVEAAADNCSTQHRQADRRLRPHDLPDDADKQSTRRRPPAFRSCRDSSRRMRALNALWFHAAARADAAAGAARRRRPATSRRTRSTPRSRATASRCRKAVTSRPPPKPRPPPRRIGFPVVLKIRSPDILHKTEAGGVALDLRSTRRRCSAAADALRRGGAHRAAGRAHRRLPGAGDGVGRRSHCRRAQRPALWTDAAGRRRRRAGGARQGRGAAPAAGERGET